MAGGLGGVVGAPSRAPTMWQGVVDILIDPVDSIMQAVEEEAPSLFSPTARGGRDEASDARSIVASSGEQ